MRGIEKPLNRSMYKFLFLLTLFSPLASQAQNLELVTVYIGEGPSLNLSFSPKMMFLKAADQETDLGIYYVIQEEAGVEKHLLQVRDNSILPEAVAAMLYERFMQVIQKKTGRLGALLPEDTLYLAKRLLAAPGFDGKTIHTLQDCTEVMTYLKDLSSTVYSASDLNAVSPLFCR